MDAFEQIVAMLLEREGYWTRISYRVELTPEDKQAIKRPSCPRWEMDVIALRPKDNQLLVVECKSYFDSLGVRSCDLVEDDDPTAKGRYKLFTEPTLREVVLRRLKHQLEDAGLMPPGGTIQLAMAVGKFKNGANQEDVSRLFKANGWRLFDQKWLELGLQSAAKESYENDVAFVVSKILTRGK